MTGGLINLLSTVCFHIKQMYEAVKMNSPGRHRGVVYGH